MRPDELAGRRATIVGIRLVGIPMGEDSINAGVVLDLEDGERIYLTAELVDCVLHLTSDTDPG